MRFEFAALTRLFRWPHSVQIPALPSVKTLAAASGAALAAVTVVYVAWPAPPRDVAVDAVIAAEPVFRPVAVTPSAPVLAERPFMPEVLPAAHVGGDAASIRAVQGRLKRAGCYSGPVNGRWSAATRTAMAKFTNVVNARLPVEQPDPVLLVLLESNTDASCRNGGGTPAVAEVASIAETPRPARLTRVDTGPEPAAPQAASRSDDEREQASPELARTASVGIEEVALGTAVATTTARKYAKADRPRAKRKVRKKSSYSRNFRRIQRSMRRLFF